ncbi:fibronectin type III domain-containing protein 7-like [Xenopus laevis]|uniref:Fibronectin type III domain-containing protein 7-like n=1 Tax=Xenopus laevis TaxID=8355 RepID=A0A8J1N177_XENLA|nr:fibronectin type III domain-containing protein 7-like [Xenopus laevis]
MVSIGLDIRNKTFTGTLNGTVDGLQPSSVYNLTLYAVNSAGFSAASRRVSVYTLTQAPGSISVTTVSSSSVTLTWARVENALMYGIFLYADGPPNNLIYIMKTTTLTITLNNLLPCTKYILNVASFNWFYVVGGKTEVPYKYGTPCAPENITVTGDCQVNTIELKWSPANDAIQYTAYALTPDHLMLECRNVVPNCFFMDLMCGTEYEISVMATSAKVNSTRSHGIKARTAPCDPGNVAAVPNCNSSVLDVSWGKSNGANTYTARALGSSGLTYNCSSVSTSCQITGVRCGDSLSVTVTAYGNDCSSWSSATDEIVTAPCRPEIITTETDCNSSSTSVQWTYSEGAILYTARAISAIDNSEYSCQSSDLLCTLTDLPCGHMFKVSVKASNFHCDSAHSQEVEIYSVPCIPNSVSSELDCIQNTVLVKWSDDSVNTTYTATIEEKGIGFNSCTTQGSYCEFHDLSCGQNFSVSVKADNGQCTSVSKWTAPSYTAPCKPTEIQANSICYNNSMQMTWSKNQAFGIEMYLVLMQSADGQHRACQSTSEVCVTEAIECGTIYEVTVTAVSDNCQSISSKIYTDPVPCSPKLLTDTVAPDFVVLTWNSVPGALNYTTEVAGGGLEKHICHTLNTSCSMTDLLCGHQYSMLVTAFGQQCSNVSDTHRFQTAPCVPQNVVTNLDCANNVATISWNSSLGANNYTTKAEGTNGQTYFCNSTSTSCVIVGLECGHSYQVTVEAANEKSLSGPSIPFLIVTVPCVPSNVQTQVNCESDSATLSWGATNGAVSYSATVIGPQNEEHLCQTANLSCNFPALSCGLEYNATIFAVGDTCNSEARSPLPFQSGK